MNRTLKGININKKVILLLYISGIFFQLYFSKIEIFEM